MKGERKVSRKVWRYSPVPQYSQISSSYLEVSRKSLTEKIMDSKKIAAGQNAD